MSDNEFEIAEDNISTEPLRSSLKVHAGFWEMFTKTPSFSLRALAGLSTFRASINQPLSQLLLREDTPKQKLMLIKYKPEASKHYLLYDVDTRKSSLLESCIFPDRLHDAKVTSLQEEVDMLERHLAEQTEMAIARVRQHEARQEQVRRNPTKPIPQVPVTEQHRSPGTVSTPQPQRASPVGSPPPASGSGKK